MENKILAKVGDREITQNEFDALLKQLGPQRAMQFQSEEGKKQLLNEIINQELFYYDAIEKKYDEKEEFKKELEFVKSNMLKQFAISNLLSDVKVEEEDLKEFYEKNKEQFVVQESVKASHILVKTEEEAKEILKKENISENFSELAKEFSSCPSKDDGGNLGEFTRGRMVPEFEEAAFNLEVNKISEPVKTQFGYHIIKVTDKKEKKNKSFEEARPELENAVLMKKQQDVYMNRVEELKKDIKVELF